MVLQEQLLVLPQENILQINNWFDFVIFTLVILTVILVGLPTSIYLLKKGTEGFVKYKFAKLPKNFLIDPGLENSSVQVFLCGLFLFVFSVWFLFFDEGGQFGNFIDQTKSFF